MAWHRIHRSPTPPGPLSPKEFPCVPLSNSSTSTPRLLRGSGPQIPGYIGAGWHPIVMRLMSDIDAMLSDELAAAFRLVQIKEKFGGIQARIRAAEEEASRTCEVCGKPGELQREGWMQTLCEHHAGIKKSGGQLDFEDGT
jgi:hypothetical protein